MGGLTNDDNMYKNAFKREKNIYFPNSSLKFGNFDELLYFLGIFLVIQVKGEGIC